MRLILLFIGIALNSLFSYTQTYEINITSPEDEVVFDAIQIDQNILFVLNHGVYDGNYSSSLIYLNSITGEQVNKVEVEQMSSDYMFKGIFKILKINDNEFVVIGNCLKYSTNDIQIFFAKYNLELELILDTIVGNTTTNEQVFDVIYSSDSLIVSVGMQQSGELLLEERDVDGVEVRSVIFEMGGILSTTVMEVPEENTYHLYRYWDTDHSFYILNKEDLSIDSLIQYPFKLLPRNAIKSNNPDNYFIAGRRLGWDETDNLCYSKISSIGEIIEEFEYFTDSIAYYSQHCLSINQSSIFFAGAYPCTWSGSLEFYPEERWILMYKLDFEGEIIWQKFYKGNVNYMPYKVLATNDGGAIIFSPFYDWINSSTNQRDLNIIKIDSNGYYLPVGMDRVPEEQSKQILVYPNPVKSQVNFVFGLYQNLEISIFNMAGKVIHQKIYPHTTSIDLSFLKPGVYPYRITDDKGFYEEGKILKE